MAAGLARVAALDQLGRFDEALAEARWVKRFSFPLGSSVFALARKPGGATPPVTIPS